MSRGPDSLEDLRQQAAEEAADRDEHDAAVDIDEPVDRGAALEQLHREPDDDQVVPWRPLGGEE